jgi:hypothetical protein
MKGQYDPPLTQEEKDRFCDLIAQGYTRPEAARALDRTARKFRALCNPASDYYDEEFTRRYERLTEAGGEQEAAIIERVESAFIERAVKESDRAAEKVLAARDPRYAFLRPKTFSGNVNVEELQVFFGELPLEKLLELKQAREQQTRLKELPAIDI